MAWILAGWTLFIVSALFFIASAWRAGDGLALVGALAFLVANGAFLVAIYVERRALRQPRATEGTEPARSGGR